MNALRYRCLTPFQTRHAVSLLLLVLLTLTVAAPAAQAQIYVDADASPGGDGSSWIGAYTDLQTALGAATGSDQIWIAEGTYTPGTRRSTSFTVTGAQDGTKIYGGFAGTESTLSQRDPDAHPVVLSGDINGDGALGGNSYHVLYLDGPITTDTVLDGVTVTGGNAVGDYVNLYNNGGGLLCNGPCSPTLRNITFSVNNAAGGGGAILNYGASGESSPVITNATFSDNSAYSGGAIYNYGEGDYEGGPYDGSSPIITNAIFVGNRAEEGGGAIYNDGQYGDSSPVIKNAAFYDNRAAGSYGGAIFNFGYYGRSSPTITNATFYGNSAKYAGGAIYSKAYSGEGRPDIRNTILYGNNKDEIYNGTGARPTLDHTLIAGGCPSQSNCGYNTVIDADPLFAIPADPDGPDDVFATDDDGLHLLAGSPAINAGDDNAINRSEDITGADRIQAGTVDLGAYEGAVSPPRFNTFTPSVGEPGTEVVITGNSFDWTTDVTIGGASASFTVDSDEQITATVPQGAADGPVAVTTLYSTVVSDATFHVAAPYGAGRALALDGSDDWMQADAVSDSLAGTQSYTIEGWVRPDLELDDQDMFASFHDDTGWNVHLLGYRYGNFFFYDQSAGSYYYSTDSFELGRWYHLAAVIDASNHGTLYVDGAPQASFTVSSRPKSSGHFSIGQEYDSGLTTSDHWNGKIDEVRIWNVARTQEEIRAAMHETLSGIEPGLVAYWRFDKGHGQTVYDYTGAHDGALEGAPQRLASTALFGQHSVLVQTTAPKTLGGLTAGITTGGDAANYLTLYDYGSASDAAILASEEALPDGISKRAALIWGVAETGSVTTDLSFSYGSVSGLDLANVRLLKREGPGAPWRDVTGQFTWDSGAKTFTADSMTTFSQFAVAEADTPLPVELTSFEARADGAGAIRLSWQTASETNNARFIVERQVPKNNVETFRRNVSTTDDGWQTIGERKGAGTTTEARRYRFTDEALPFTADTVQYRLRQIDTGGAATVSEERAVAVGAPQRFRLRGAFPNPFRRATTLRYELPQAARVRLAVYDVLGRRVRTLVDERQEGRQELRFEARGLASGVYFYRITVGDYTETRKLVRVR